MTTETVALERISKSLRTSDLEPELLVHIPRDAISVLSVSLSLHLFYAIQAHATQQLRSHLSSLSSLPQGEL